MNIIDVSMWGMDGIKATREILVCCPARRVVMLSIYDTLDSVQHAIEAGARGYVLKDVAAEELVNAIHVVTGGTPVAERWMEKER